MLLSKDEMSLKDVVKGEYLNKIRLFAVAEKKFSVFGTLDIGEPYLKVDRFFDMMIPFQYLAVKENEEVMEILSKNESYCSSMSRIDVNGDGQISFEEYLILVALLNR